MVATLLDEMQTQDEQQAFQSPKMRINGCNMTARPKQKQKQRFQSPKMRINGCNVKSGPKGDTGDVGPVSVPENED